MIDTHCHLNYAGLIEDIDGVLERAAAAGVERLIIPGTTVPDSESGVRLAERYDQVWACVGVHPSHASELTEDGIDRLEALVKHPKVVAVGEIGLDYYEMTSPEPEVEKALQGAVARRMVQLAKEAEKPLIIHSRDCFDDLYALLKEEARGWSTVIHCFTGTVEEAAKWLDLGFHISITGIVTYKNAQNVRDVAAMVPWDRLMIETDAPFLAPVPYRGKTCEPAMVAEVLAAVAGVKGVSVAEAGELTTTTSEVFFNLRK